MSDSPQDQPWGAAADERVEAAGFLLCGGQSSRMGTDKALLLLNGERLVERGVRTLREVCTEVAIAGGTADLEVFGRVVPDAVQGCGPLGGIVSALEQSAKEWNLFLPVDAPFVPSSALKVLLLTAARSSSLCVMARAGGRVHPLCAAYSRNALPALQKKLSEGRWKVTEAISAAGTYELVDFTDESWFLNLNTPDEFTEASRIGVGR